eukprot:3162557-Pyramimonas_sp.AAC.1
MQELRARMSQLETSTSAGSSGKRHIALLNSLDISNKQVSFIGFESTDAAERAGLIEQFASSLQGAPRGT